MVGKRGGERRGAGSGGGVHVNVYCVWVLHWWCKVPIYKQVYVFGCKGRGGGIAYTT